MRAICYSVGVAFAAALAATGTVDAAAISGSMHEPFDYPEATQFGPNSTNNGGAGWNAAGNAGPNAATANWGATGIPAAHAGAANLKTAISPGLTYTATGYLPASGRKLQLNDPTTASATQSIGRSLGGQSIDSGTFFFSYLTEKNNATDRTINFAFFNTPSSERLAIGQINGAATTSGNIGVIVNAQNPSGVLNAANPIAYGVNVTHLIVGRIDFNSAGNDALALWVDPTDVTTQAAAGSVYLTTSAFDFAAFTTIRPFVGSTQTGFPAGSADFDEIRLGGTWESVTSLPVVPEPGSVALIALASIALIRRRPNS